MSNRTVLVSGLNPDINKEDLYIYFQSKKRSNGDEIENLEYNRDIGEATITFCEQQVAIRVSEREHVLQGHRLSVIVYQQPKTMDLNDKSLCVLVQGFPANTTKDSLQNYFENTRRSSGGDVKKIEINGDSAVITFESSQSATRVLEWGKHTLHGHSLTVTRIKPVFARKITSQEPEPIEEHSCIVSVKNIPPKMTKDDLLNFFENKRRSGGGEVTDIQYIEEEGIADITFADPQDAEKVAKKESLPLGGSHLTLCLKEIPKELPVDLCKVHVLGLPDKTSTDGLTNYMEVVSGQLEVKNIIFGEYSNAMITFTESADFEKIQKKCAERSFNGSHMKVEKVSICDCIEVSGFISEKTTHDTILYYFENKKKSGVGNVKKVEYQEGGERALVFFEDPQDVEKVITRKHFINESLKVPVKVIPYYPFLGETSEEPGGGKKERFLSQDGYKTLFIEKFLLQEFVTMLKDSGLGYKFNHNQDEIQLFSVEKMDKIKWEASCRLAKEYIDQISAFQINTGQEAWKEFTTEATKRLHTQKDFVEVTSSDQDQSMSLIGKKKDVDPLAEDLTDLRKEIETKIDYEKSKVTEEINLTPVQVDLINYCGSYQHLKTELKEIDIKMKDSVIVFRGPDHLVREGNLKFWKMLSKIKDREIEIPTSIAHVLLSKEGMLYLSQEFNKRNIEAVVCAADPNARAITKDTKIIVTAFDRQDVNEAVNLIKEVVHEEKLELDKEQQVLLSSEEWRQIQNEVQQSKLIKISVDPLKNILSIVGIIHEVEKVKEYVGKFFDENAIMEELFEIDSGHKKYLKRFARDQIKKIEDTLKQYSVQISFVEDDCESIMIHGTKQGTQKTISQIQKIVERIKEKRLDLDKPGLRKFFRGKKGADQLSVIESNNSCIVERCCPSDEKPSATPSNMQQVCSFVTPENKRIKLIKGDITEFRVDAIVNAANSRLQHVGGLAKAILNKGGDEIQKESNEIITSRGDLVTGEAITTSPGRLPCKRLIHAVGPTWNKFSNTNKRGEETREERMLSQTILNAMNEAIDVNSIAIPAVSAGVFGFPADACAKTIVSSILEFCEENANCNLSEIFIVDTNEDVIKAFTSEIRSRFGKSSSFKDSAGSAKKKPIHKKAVGKRSILPKATPPSNNVTVNSSIANIGGIKMEIIVGDLAKEESHVIVNTVASDLDLSKNPCARALSNAAGLGLQQECKRKGTLNVGEVHVTQGYALGCKNVFHVVAGAAWQNGQGEEVLRSLVLSCLKEASSQGFQSIAFPAIGTGNLGFPRDVVAKIFFEEVQSFKNNFPKTCILEVHMVLFHKDQPTIDAFQKELKSWITPNVDGGATGPSPQSRQSRRRRNITRDVDSDEDSYGSKKSQIGSVNVELVPGDITNETTKAIVTVSNTSLDVSLGSGVGAAIAKAGGQAIQKECKKLGHQPPGSVVCTTAGKLPSGKLYHLIPASYKSSDITSVLLKCFEMAENQGTDSISIPAVGTGNVNLGQKEAAKALLKAVGKFCKSKPVKLKVIRIVVFQVHMIQDFHNALDDLIKTESGSTLGSIWSLLKWFFSSSEEKRSSDLSGPLSFGNERYEEMGDSSPEEQPQMWLKILALDGLSRATSDVKKLIKDQFEKKVIENRQAIIEELNQSQKDQILRLENKHCTEIVIEKRTGRIIVSGVPEYVVETVNDIYTFLHDLTEKEHQRKYAEVVAKNVQWFYVHPESGKEKYDDETNAKIEDAHSKSKDSIVLDLYDENYCPHSYKLDFKSMKEIDCANGDKIDIIREEVGKGIPLPSHWDPQPKDSRGKEKDVHLVTLDDSKKEYKDIEKAIIKTSPINIVKIERVQNPELYRSYVVKKQKMEDRGKSNEMMLFHGTPTTTCDLISLKGFDRSFCGKNAVVYGRGVYFARDASYSMRPQYSPPDPQGQRCMYYASVLVGKYTVGNQNLAAAPPIDQARPTITYDTTVDNAANPTIFVAYRDSQVYPDYLITFN